MQRVSVGGWFDGGWLALEASKAATRLSAEEAAKEAERRRSKDWEASAPCIPQRGRRDNEEQRAGEARPSER